jgi:ATP-binding cassette, subfamily B, bacterial
MQRLPTTLPAFFWHFIKPYKWRFLLIFLAPIPACFESTIFPYTIKKIVDAAEKSKVPLEAVPEITNAMLVFISVWIGLMIFYRIQEWVQFEVISRTRANIRTQVTDYVLGHSHKYFSENFAGSTANRISDIARASIDLIYWVNWQFTAGMSNIIASVIMTAFMNINLALIMLGFVIFGITVSYFSSKGVSKYSEKNANDGTMLKGNIVDVLTNITNVRSFARSKHERTYLLQKQDVERKSHKRLLLAHWINHSVGEIPYISLLIASGFTVLKFYEQGVISAGEFAFIVYSVINIIFKA